MSLLNRLYRSLLEIGSKLRAVDVGLGTIPYDSGNTRSIEIPRGALVKGLTLRLSGALVVGVANAANIFSEAPLGLLKSIELTADGNVTLFKASARNLYRLAHFFQQKQPELTAPASTTGTKTFAATIPISAEALRMIRPQESYYDTRLYTETRLVVVWGLASDIATAGGGGGTIAIDASTVLDVQVAQTTEGDSDVLFDRVVTQSESDVVASNPTFLVKIPQNGLLAGVFMQTDRDAGAGAGPVPVNNIINFVSFKSDVSIYHRKALNFATLQRRNVAEYQLDTTAGLGAPVDGYAYLDLAEDGMMSSLLNTYALQDPFLELDVTRTSGTEKLRTTFIFFRPRATA